ncbi:MAG TPA: VOC family protein, partial [Acidimicrobiales bacterium]|nr:VOC family protein [Acidimicrobiales bacterium]
AGPMAIGPVWELVIDCHDPASIARFYAAVIGGTVIDREPAWSVIEPNEATGLRIGFQRVPEGKVVKNRVHLDVLAPDLEASTRAALELGATKQGGVVFEEDGAFQVLLDPEGNELCLVTGP